MAIKSTSPERAKLNAPLSALPLLALGLAMMAAAIGYCYFSQSMPYDSDSRFYRAIVDGRIAEVHKPFTNRVLHPWLVQQLSEWTGTSTDTAFVAVATAGLALLLAAGLWWVRRWLNSFALIAAILFTPGVLVLYRQVYLPDLLHAALTGGLFVVLELGGVWSTMVVLFLMQVARESTILLSGLLVLVSAYKRRWKIVGVTILATVIGMAVAGRVADEGLPNIHKINNAVYLAAKVPFNFLKNICGVNPWTDTLAANNPDAYPGEPLVTMDLPTWIPAGSIKKVGIHSFCPECVLGTFQCWLTLYGVMPSIVIPILVRRHWRFFRDDGHSVAVLLASCYGLISFLLGPMLGASVARLVAYGWPMSWIAAPALMSRYLRMDPAFISKLATLQAVTCWTPFVAGLGLGIYPASFVSIAVALPCHWATLRLARGQRIDLSGKSSR